MNQKKKTFLSSSNMAANHHVVTTKAFSSTSSIPPLKQPAGRRSLRDFFWVSKQQPKHEIQDSGEFTSATVLTGKQSMNSTTMSARTLLKVEENIISTTSFCPTQPVPCPYQLDKHAYFEELGYMRSESATMGEAQSMALACDKPLLAIEARIPGDSDAGRDVFSHPLIVEAASSFFTTYIRVVVSGEDEPRSAGAASFAERAPSGKPCRTKVLFLDPHTGEFLADPLYGDFLTCACMASAMLQVIKDWRIGVQPPRYLSLLCEEEMGKVDLKHNHGPRPKDYTAFFATEDSAAAEVEFAGLDGVFATRAAFINGRRVVAVSYNSSKIAFCSLARHALQHGTANAVYYKTNDEKRAAEVEIARTKESTARLELFQGTLQADHNPKNALRKTPLKFVPLTDIQATKANRLVHLGRFDEAMHLLSPLQGMILMEAMRIRGQKQFHEVVDVPIIDAWMGLSEHVRNPEQSSTSQVEDDNSDDVESLSGFDAERRPSHDFGILSM